MDKTSDQNKGSAVDFKNIWENGEFWSCWGYEGLSMVFDLPLEPFQHLLEPQQRALMRLLGHLAAGLDEALHNQVNGLQYLTGEERLTSLVALSERFASED
jgi:hypothetical protein